MAMLLDIRSECISSQTTVQVSQGVGHGECPYGAAIALRTFLVHTILYGKELFMGVDRIKERAIFSLSSDVKNREEDAVQKRER
jgi:hypothetical protein